MSRYQIRALTIFLLILTFCLLIGCRGPARAEEVPTATRTLVPTPVPASVSTSTPAATPAKVAPSPSPTVAVKECGAAPCLAATPTAVAGLDPAFAALVDPEPAEATLVFGSDVQKGAHGYAVWCTASGQMAIYENFGPVSIPTSALVVPQGSVVTFSYLGADPLRQILAHIYPAALAGTPSPPGQRTTPTDTGFDVPVTQTDRKGAITLAVSPGEYAIFIDARLQSDARAEGCGAHYQFRVRVT